MCIDNAIKEFLIEIEVRKYSPRTIRSYRVNLGLFLRFCQEKAHVTEIEDLSLAIVKQFKLFMSESGRKGTYINSLLKSIKSFTQYCYDEGYGGFNTKRNFSWCKEEKTVITAFSVEDVRKLLRSCRGNDFLSLRDNALITMFFETGIRCLELCCIRDADIHDDYIIINGKNHKQRVVPITPILKKAMLRYQGEREQYFMLRPHVENILKKHGDGIENIRVSPHTCRHFYAQQQVKMGTDLYTISRLLGHENISITQTYLNSLRDQDVIQIAKQRSVLMSF